METKERYMKYDNETAAGKMYFVCGCEPFKVAQVWGIHGSKQKALKQAAWLEQTKPAMTCQRYEVVTKTEIKRRKLALYA